MGTNIEECLIDSEEDCRVRRSVYSTECVPCDQDPTAKKAVYIGTTGRTTHARQTEHKRAILGRNNSNALYKHQRAVHPNQRPDFNTKIVKGGFQWNLERQIYEALEIDECSENPNLKLLNQRSEWGQRGLPKLRIDDN